MVISPILMVVYSMLANHIDAEMRYGRLRREALKAAHETLISQNITNIKLDTISSEALNASRLWDNSKSRQVNWDWFESYRSFKHRYPKRFEMAIWDKKSLIGLSMGRPTYQGTALRLDFVEAAPLDLGERPSIIEYVLLGYDIYSRMLNAKQIRIMNPINNKVLSYYKKFGYSYVAKGDYLYKDIS